MASIFHKRRHSGPPVSRTERIFDGVIVICTLIVSFSMLYPLLFVLGRSFSSPDTVNLSGMSILPKKWSLIGYSFVLKSSFIWTGYLNTIIRTVLGTAIGLAVSIGYAYPLSKKNLPGRNVLTFMLILTMFASGGLVPEYILIKNLGLFDTIWSMVLPTAMKAFNVVIIRNFFMSIPEELDEAAEIDGSSAIGTLFSIMLPVSMPIIATISLWMIVQHWNAWFDCLLYMRDPNRFVLQIVLRRIIFESSVEMTGAVSAEQQVSQEVVKYATIIVATAPILMVYPFIQKYFVKGVMMGSLKG